VISRRRETLLVSRPSPRSASGGRPTQDKSVRCDERLLEVTTYLSIERGFEGTSIDDVDEAAGVRKPSEWWRVLRCVVFHRRHRRGRAFGHATQCVRCGRLWFDGRRRK
jgi:hypothetical protein